MARSRTALLAIIWLTVLTAGSQRLASSNRLLILFHGYVNGQGRSATATINDSTIADVRDLPLRNGGDLSPSGEQVAFDTCDRANRAIAVAAVDGSQKRFVEPIDGQSCATVRWARDGRRLSYAGAYDLLVHVVDLRTGTDTALPNTFLAPGWHSWSRRSDAIAYETGRGGTRRIDVIDLATWQTRTLVGPQQFGSCEVWAPDWSPAADRIVFTSCEGKLFVVNADSSELRQLASDAYAPRWAPDGEAVFFLTAGILHRVTLDGRAMQTIARLPLRGGPFSIAGATQPQAATWSGSISRRR